MILQSEVTYVGLQYAGWRDKQSILMRHKPERVAALPFAYTYCCNA